MKRSKHEDSYHQGQKNGYGNHYKNSHNSDRNQNYNGHGSNRNHYLEKNTNSHHQYQEVVYKEVEKVQTPNSSCSRNSSNRNRQEQTPISIEYQQENILLGTTWQEISRNIDKKVNCSVKVKVALKVCLLNRIKQQV
jgi:cell fate (sporulation/competence/biofilm development) regulator YmcA (YheA/YmcA/DUF963 family)